MKLRLFPASLLVLFCLAGLQNALSQASLPSTPAGQVMKAFQAAFNSADSHQLSEYIERYGGTSTAEELLAFSNSTGGFSVVSVTSSKPGRVWANRGGSHGVPRAQ